jgi:hypothetical protein
MDSENDFQKRLAETLRKLRASGIKVTERRGSFGFIGGVRSPTKRSQSVLERETGTSNRPERHSKPN